MRSPLLPVGLTPAATGRRTLGLGLLALLTFAIGFLGQGLWRIGVRAEPPAISAIATDVIGGAGNRLPIRTRVTIAVANHGADEIQVINPADAAAGVSVIDLEPPVLTVRPGQVGQLNADIAVRCDQATPLLLPALRVELIDGVRSRLPVGGSGLLQEACSRAAAPIRPLAVSIGAGSTGPTPSAKTQLAGGLTIALSSPTGRPARVSAIRAGGVDLAATPLPVSVAAGAPVGVRLSAPGTCPVQWQVIGIPRTLEFDLAASSPSGSVSTVQLPVGPVLTSWLLANSCPATR
jgi:hypothetical protein